MEKTIGQKLSPVLNEIEDTLWEFEYHQPTKQTKYTKKGFRSATKIFMSALMDKMWDFQEKNKLSQKEREKQAQESGESIRSLIKKYTGIDSHDLYKEK
jgi:hypothetical protein